MPPQIPNIYTLGQIQVSTQPLAQLQGRLLAQKQAKEEALNKYFEGQLKDLSREGIALNDFTDFEKKKKDIQDYWIQNKDSISRGGSAKMDFDNRVDDLKSFISQSKDKKTQLAKINELRLKGDIDEDDLPLIDRIGAPVMDKSKRLKPDGTPYSLFDFSAAVPLPDVSKQNSFWGAVSQGLKPKMRDYEKDQSGKVIYSELMPGSFEKVAKYTDRYTKDQLVDMANRASGFAATDKSFRKLYSSVLKNPEDPKFVELAKVYTEYFPNDIMDRPEEVAKADAILRFSKFGESGQEKFRDVKAQKAFESQLIQSRSKGREGVIDLSEYDVLGPYTESKGVTSKGLFGGLFGGGGKTLVYKRDIDPKDYELIADENVIPFTDNAGEEYFIVDPESGDWKAENVTISRSSAARRNLDRTTLAEEKRGATKFKPSAPIPGKSVPSGKTYNVGGKSFTLDQMKKGASKAKMTLDEYLKSIGAK